MENTTMKLKTLIHEYAHAQLHRMDSPVKDLPKKHKEAQAEATAFMVTKYFGIDTEAYSAGYIATWAKDINLAKQALGEIQKTANNIIREIDHLNKERFQEVTQQKPMDKEEERAFLLKESHKAATHIAQEFVSNPSLFNDEKGKEIKFLLNYIDKIQNGQAVPDRMANDFVKISDKIFKESYDKPELAESKSAKLVDYIERYSKADFHGKSLPDPIQEVAATSEGRSKQDENQKSNVIEFPKAKSGPDLER
ncbi:hypothetical protein [Paenibacillus sp. NPDC055715]